MVAASSLLEAHQRWGGDWRALRDGRAGEGSPEDPVDFVRVLCFSRDSGRSGGLRTGEPTPQSTSQAKPTTIFDELPGVRDSILCYAIVLPGRKPDFRAGFWPDCYRERTEIGPPAGLRPAGGPISVLFR